MLKYNITNHGFLSQGLLGLIKLPRSLTAGFLVIILFRICNIRISYGYERISVIQVRGLLTEVWDKNVVISRKLSDRKILESVLHIWATERFLNLFFIYGLIFRCHKCNRFILQF
jgi:hypothetical protein